LKSIHYSHPMKFLSLAAIVAGAGIAQVLAAPLLVVFPLTEPHAHGSDLKILPFIGTPTFVRVSGKEMEGGFKVNFSDLPEHHRHHHPQAPHHHGHRGNKHHRCKGSFVNRIHRSLRNLGRWEGRAVAFVLGCGIGVLLRMFFVLGLVMYRAVRGQPEEQHEYSQITIIEEVVDTPKSAPPSYSYPVDEKVPILVETAEAPATTEGSK